MIDIHTHILPNVDDGAENFENALALLKQAEEQGVTHIILTPHAIINSSTYVSKEELEERFADFQKKTKDINIKLFLGSEIFYTDKMCRELVAGQLKTFDDSPYVLIEFSMHAKEDIEEILYNIRVRGYKPILAHPERYSFLDIDDVVLIKENALIQINTTSILGEHGKKVKKFAYQMMKLNLVDFVSSDCHHPTNRSVNLKEAFNIVRKKFGEKFAKKVFVENQAAMIAEFNSK